MDSSQHMVLQHTVSQLMDSLKYMDQASTKPQDGESLNLELTAPQHMVLQLMDNSKLMDNSQLMDTSQHMALSQHMDINQHMVHQHTALQLMDSSQLMVLQHMALQHMDISQPTAPQPMVLQSLRQHTLLSTYMPELRQAHIHQLKPMDLHSSMLLKLQKVNNERYPSRLLSADLVSTRV